ncbi:MAG: serine/threonine protein phosphatase PrpC, partial [Gammaproteobacteria bacterium]
MDLYFEIAGGQIDGARDYQEDAYLTTYVDDDQGGHKSAALVIMADGMGGHAAGNIASNLVVQTFNQTFSNSFGKQDVSGLLRDALIKANNGLSESIRETPALDGMGCTMVAAALCKGKVWWSSVGDSHLYILRDRELHKKNEDHSYGGYLDRMAAQGMDVEPEPGLSRNMLMSAMTGEDIAEIDCPAEPLQLLSGDRLVVASDGLDTLGTGTIIQMSAWSSTPKECVDALLNAVEDAGKPRQDNTTVVVIDVMESAVPVLAPPPPAPARSREPDPDATQPLNLADIEAALQAERDASIVHREADYNP